MACLSFAASEIAADKIAAINQPPTQRAENLDRRLALRRPKFTPPRKSPQFDAARLQCSVVILDLYTVGVQGRHGVQSHSV